jgi:hypothetical protein
MCIISCLCNSIQKLKKKVKRARGVGLGVT